jgi:hypothetical protein
LTPKEITRGSSLFIVDISESTVVYVHRDFQPRDKRTTNSKYKAVDVNDGLMRGMTIAEMVNGLDVGGSDPPWKAFFLSSSLINVNKIVFCAFFLQVHFLLHFMVKHRQLSSYHRQTLQSSVVV